MAEPAPRTSFEPMRSAILPLNVPNRNMNTVSGSRNKPDIVMLASNP
jgi:hypothetical protein